MKSCILADNQFITNKGLAVLLHASGIEDIRCAASVSELQEALSACPDALVIVDYTLFDFASMQQMLIVKEAAKESTWLLFSDELGEPFLRYVLVADPTVSVLMKQDAEGEVREALHRVINGHTYICEFAEHVLSASRSKEADATPDPVKLTASEKMILHEIALGKTTKEIAYEKNLSFHTVNSHRKNLFRKLEVNSLHEAIRYAIRAGIFDVAEFYI